jgi:hypothetical protein
MSSEVPSRAVGSVQAMDQPAGVPVRVGTTRRRCLLAGGLFLVVLVVYVRSPVVTVTDSVWVIPTAFSLADEHDADLDEYPDAIAALDGWQLVTAPDGRTFYKVPVASSLLVLPMALVARAVDPAVDADVRAGRATTVEPVLASIVVAAAVAVVLLTALASGASEATALVAALVFAFATSAWSTASRALWMHGPSMLVVALSLYALVRARADERRRPFDLGAAGALLALAFFVRPTNAVVAVAFGVYAVVAYRRRVLPLVAGAGAVTIAFVALDLALYGSVLPDYIRSDRLALSATVLEALAGNLVSPARGLLVYSPVLLFAVYGFVRLRRSPPAGFARADGLEIAAATAVAAQWLVVSLFPHWWAGWAYGPRFLADVLPLIVWFLPAALTGLRARPVALTVFAVLAAGSVFVHARGATADATFIWNTEPVNVDDAPGRLWDWGDPPFLR